MTSLLGLLPSPVGLSAKAPPPDTPEALQYIAVLQCLQRLVSAPALAGVMLSTAGVPLGPHHPLHPPTPGPLPTVPHNPLNIDLIVRLAFRYRPVFSCPVARLPKVL